MTATAEIAIRSATDRLKAARAGVADMQAGPDRYQSGMMNAVMLGRTITIALQNMRGSVEGFDEWYQPHQDEMKSDDTMRFFIDLRNRLEKQAITPTYSGVELRGTGNLLRAFGPPPPGAKGQFIGDRYGRSGWVIVLPDGSEDEYFVSLPKHMVSTEVYFDTEIPELKGIDPIVAITRYLDRLETLISDARSRFLS